MKKKLLILGGTGFLGYYTTMLALKKGYEVGSISLNDVNLEGWLLDQTIEKLQKLLPMNIFTED